MSAPVDVLAVRYYVAEVEARTEFAAVSTGDLMDLPVYMEVPGDPLLGGRYQYVDGGWGWIEKCPRRPQSADPQKIGAPLCGKGCRYLKVFDGYARQRNALRTEVASMVQPERCGWNLMPGKVGGHPLDYAPCTSAALARVQGGAA